jgi:AcrR family transcriptional regulator
MASIAKHRHAVDGGYARGEETRARIVAAAIKLFGERGFEGASTRDIATSAGVNAPALQYYFDNKEGVYVACVEHMVSRVWEQLSEVVERAQRALADHADDAALIEAFCAIQTRIAEFMFASQETEDWRLFMARQQAGLGPQAGFQIFYQNVSERMSAVTSAIVGRLIGRPAGDDETLIRTMALNGQLVFFQLMRRTVLTTLKWDAVDAERRAIFQRIVTEHTATLLRSMIAARDSARTGLSPSHDRPRRGSRATPAKRERAG